MMDYTLFITKFVLVASFWCLTIGRAVGMPTNNWFGGIEIPFGRSVLPQPIDREIYNNLFTYAHLIDISYCVSNVNQISEPFNCELDCQKRFPNVTLVHQWYNDDSDCGYIATTTSNIFNYNLSSEGKKTIIVSLRGTHSFFDSYTDIKVDMMQYSNLQQSLPYCGRKCMVHKGFFEYFAATLLQIHDVLDDELSTDDYELIIVGHSMGGSVALFLALHYLDLGYDKLTLVTMGQPLVGNKEFVTWADEVLGSLEKPVHNTFHRKYFRVVHKNDIVTTIPKTNNLMNSYHQFDNQIYLNCSATNSEPSPDEVVDCVYGDNQNCIKGDFQPIKMIEDVNRNYYFSHNTYFRKMGLCGMKIFNQEASLR